MQSKKGGVYFQDRLGKREAGEIGVGGRMWYVFFVEQFIHQNGYLTVFVTVALAGELGLMAGAALARTGAVSLTGVIILGTAASFIANTIYYYAGKVLWGKWTFLREKFGEKVDRSSGVVRRYGSPLMLVARFFYGVRDIVPVTLGLYRVEPGLFTLYNIIGAFVWAFFFTVLGDAFAGFIRGSFRNIQTALLWGAAVAVVLFLLYMLIRRAVSKIR